MRHRSLSRLECQKWRNIVRKFGVTSAASHAGLVLGGACLARAWHVHWGTCLWSSVLHHSRRSPHHNFRPLRL